MLEDYNAEHDLRQSIIDEVDKYYFQNNLVKDKLYAELILIISGV
jgi:hypothetical protein